MENVYSTYTRKIENTTYHFVKKYLVFNEYKNVSPVLEGFGMHTDFEKACAIAGVNIEEIKLQLLNKAGDVQQAKVIDLNDPGKYNQKAAGL